MFRLKREKMGKRKGKSMKAEGMLKRGKKKLRKFKNVRTSIVDVIN